MFGHSISMRRLDVRAALSRMAYFLPLLWVAAVVGGLAALQSYKSRPGTAGQTPARFTELPPLVNSAGRPRLLMFVHPKCPCSRASLSELTYIVEREPGKVMVEVVFVKPAGPDFDWANTPLREQAAAIAGVGLVDDDGTLAHRLGAETSGYVVLYDADGKLLFSGGITRARGHEGDSSGRHAICALLNGDADAVAGAKSPVFGCPLFAPGECVEPKASVDGVRKSP
jgi:hypothetical protein